jgi:arginyl-tRNA synthetase
VQRLVAAGKTYEKDGALWLRTTDYGDDKDRVMRKSDGTFTYFVPDVAYHINKFERGFVKVINVQGTDHHGTMARVRAGLQAAGVGIPPGYPDYVLHKMVTVMRGGAGGEDLQARRQLRDAARPGRLDQPRRGALLPHQPQGRHRVRVRRRPGAEGQRREPGVLRAVRARAHLLGAGAVRSKGGDASPAALAAADLSLLAAPTEQALLLKLADYPEMLTRAAADLAPHDVAFYLRDLAAALHTWYAAERFLADDPALARARMALLAATRQVLRNALAVLGVSAPRPWPRTAGEAAA